MINRLNKNRTSGRLEQKLALGIGRTPKWVQAILDERGMDMAAFKSIPMYQIHASS